MKQDRNGTIYVYGCSKFFDYIDNDGYDYMEHKHDITRLKIPKQLMLEVEFEDGGFDFVPAIQENDEEEVCLVYFNATLHYNEKEIIINPTRI